ncbi:hypothetical protein LJC42_08210 [Eubacteriales bacterium OttesenSCG-928-K08]|nr:hypothetical protein [Eubacteriales bacterium OttesenSCG-928-K08]
MKQTIKNDSLFTLLHECAPKPDAAFNAMIANSLDELCETAAKPPMANPPRIRNFATKRPLAFICMLLLLLLTAAGTTYALISLFRSVFYETKQDIDRYPLIIEEREEFWREEIDSGRAEQYNAGDMALDDEQMPKETLIDMITDFESTVASGLIGTINEMQDTLGIVGLMDQQIILSEVALLESRPRMFFLGFAFEQEIDCRSIHPTIRIDGHDQPPAQYFDYAQYGNAATNQARFAIYYADLIRTKERMCNVSLIEVRIQDACFVFYYEWATQSAILPKDNDQKEDWLLESIRLHNSIDSAIHELPYSNEYGNDIAKIIPSSFYMQGFDIVFEAEMIVRDRQQGINPQALLTVNGISYVTGEEDVQTYWLYDRSQDFSQGTYQIGWRWQIPLHYEEQPEEFAVDLELELYKGMPKINISSAHFKAESGG